jgi:cell division protein FtsL
MLKNTMTVGIPTQSIKKMQTMKLKREIEVREARKAAQGGSWGYLGLVVWTAVLAIAFVTLDHGNKNLRRDIDAKTAELSRSEDRIVNLDAQVLEKTQLSFIKGRLQANNLDLRPSQPGQVRHISHFDKGSRPARSEAREVASLRPTRNLVSSR